MHCRKCFLKNVEKQTKERDGVSRLDGFRHVEDVIPVIVVDV